jgi:hypothetical protein
MIIGAVLWGALIIIDIILWTRRNDPNSAGDNPADSYFRCCVPEYYNTNAKCPNFGVTPQVCFPPRVLSDLGGNPDFLFSFIWEIFYFIFFGVFGAYALHFMRLMGEFEAGGDKNFVQQTLVETKTPYYVPVGKDPTKSYYGAATPINAAVAATGTAPTLKKRT